MIQKAMTSAFDLASAGDTVLGRVPAPVDPKWTDDQKRTQKAEVDLVSYVFEEMMNGDSVNANSNEYKDARFTLQHLLGFKDFKGIARAENIEIVNKKIAQTNGKPYNPPKPPPSGVTVVQASEYKQKDNIFVYCDFARFGEIGKDCSGKDYKPSDPNNKQEYRCNKALNIISNIGDTASKCEHQDPNSSGKTEVSSYFMPCSICSVVVADICRSLDVHLILRWSQI